MGTTRKTITLTDKQDQWIKAQIAAGEYTNDSECAATWYAVIRKRTPSSWR